MPVKYDCHVFVCANQKAEGKKCCGEEAGMEAVKFLREKVRGKTGQRNIRIQKAGCLDLCSKGPVLVVYPKGEFYQYNSQEDLETIAEEVVLNGKSAQNLLIQDDN